MRLGFEDAHMSVRTHDRLRGLLDERVSLVGVDGLVEQLRMVKDADEVAAIRAACQLADAALEQVLAEGLIGRTEREVALALEIAMRELGAKRPSFDTIIAAGPHGALPHAQPRDVVIGPDQLVVIDWGAELDGYCSDCTRTVATGPVSEHAEEIYALVRSAQLAGLEGVAAGRHGREVDAVARQVIADAGHGEHYGHGLGHGVGIEVHEAPAAFPALRGHARVWERRLGRAGDLPPGRPRRPDRGPRRRHRRRLRDPDGPPQGPPDRRLTPGPDGVPLYRGRLSRSGRQCRLRPGRRSLVFRGRCLSCLRAAMSLVFTGEFPLHPDDLPHPRTDAGLREIVLL